MIEEMQKDDRNQVVPSESIRWVQQMGMALMWWKWYVLSA